jgi:NTE family protein
MNTDPLRDMLRKALEAPEGVIPGISENIRTGRLDAVAVITTNYLTGQTVTWVQGRDFYDWQRPHRKSVQTDLTVEHVMASSALPIVFPAVQIGRDWYGDGGIRLTAPLAPALHLGADRILALSTRYKPSMEEAQKRDTTGYPPPARVVGLLLNAIFLDSLEQDASTLERVNHFVRRLPASQRAGYREVDLMMMRPSIDLATLAAPVEAKVSGALKTLLRVMGTDMTKTPDWVSLVVFDPDYITAAMEVGFNDARSRQHEFDGFFAGLL